MNKRYQVFLSSTYTDLAETRRTVTWGLLDTLDYLPVGMEAFPSTDDRGWGVIDQLLQTTDYYVLIVGGRYGTVAEGEGISWTHKEYLRARALKIPVLAFIQRSDRLLVGKSETDEAQRTRLEDFKKTLRSSHHCREWSEPSELLHAITQALGHQVKLAGGGGGWVREKEVRGGGEVGGAVGQGGGGQTLSPAPALASAPPQKTATGEGEAVRQGGGVGGVQVVGVQQGGGVRFLVGTGEPRDTLLVSRYVNVNSIEGSATRPFEVINKNAATCLLYPSLKSSSALLSNVTVEIEATDLTAHEQRGYRFRGNALVFDIGTVQPGREVELVPFAVRHVDAGSKVITVRVFNAGRPIFFKAEYTVATVSVPCNTIHATELSRNPNFPTPSLRFVEVPEL